MGREEKSHELGGQAFTYTLAAVLSALIGFVSVPITTRVFQPEQLGQLSIFGSVQSILIIVITLGLDQAYLRFFPDMVGERARNRLWTIVALGSVLAWLVLSSVAVSLEPFFSVSSLIVGRQNSLVAVSLAMAVLFAIFSRFALIEARNARLGRAFLWLTLLSSLASKGALILGGILWGKASPSIALAATASGIICGLSLWFLRYRGRRLEFPISRSLTNEVARYSLPFVASGLLLASSTLLMPILVRYSLGFSAAGQYSAVLSVVGIVTVVQTGILMFWTPFVFSTHRANPEAVRRVQQTAVVGLLALGVVLFISRPWVMLLVGPDVREGSSIFDLLVLAAIFTTVGEIGGVGILLRKRSGTYALTQALATTLSLALVVGLTQTLGLLAVGIALAASGVVLLISRIVVGSKFFRPFTAPNRVYLGAGLVTVLAVLGTLPSASETLSLSAGIVGLILFILLFMPEISAAARAGCSGIVKVLSRVRRTKR